MIRKLNKAPMPEGTKKLKQVKGLCRLADDKLRLVYIPGQHGNPSVVLSATYRREAYNLARN